MVAAATAADLGHMRCIFSRHIEYMYIEISAEPWFLESLECLQAFITLNKEDTWLLTLTKMIQMINMAQVN